MTGAALLGIVRTMRPHQWVKNLFVVAPLVFAEQALNFAHFLHAAAAFIVFSVLSGCVYILNDLLDVEQDRQHPVKSARPIASGALPVNTAKTALAVLLIGAVVTSYVALQPSFAAIGLSYFVLNVAYSFALKHVPFVDVACIAGGFLLRLVGGAVAIGVPITVWIVACTFLLAVYLALGKRKHEIVQAGTRKKEQRKVLERYVLEHVSVVMRVLAVLTGLTYIAYTVWGAQTGRLFHPRDLVYTIPFVCFGLWRFERLTQRTDDGRSPTDLMLKDVPFILNLVLWSIAVVVIIYAR